MRDLADGETAEIKGSAAQPYLLKNQGGVYSCSCPAWRNQSIAIERRTCKHLKALRGQVAEVARVGATPAPARPARTTDDDGAAVLSNAPPLLLAHSWDGVNDMTGWWLSEKLDGVRAYWDGKAFISRLGNVYHAPDWFVQGLPPCRLDGELWGGRKRFQRTISIVRRQDRSLHWQEIRYVVFDAPDRAEPFEDRLAFCRRTLEEQHAPHAEVLEHVRCRGVEHLQQELARIESEGGEGLMLRRPGSLYEVGRSSTLLKVKSFHDAEARVVEHLAGAGRHQGRLGALQVELQDGTRFAVGTGFRDAERHAPPPIGSLITFRYQELSEGGVPRFPTYVGVREDVAWPAPTASATAAPPSAPASTPVAAPATPAPVANAAQIAARRFEFASADSSKFWEIEVDGNQHTVRFGRIGTSGQAKTKTFASAEAATRDASALIAEKTRKGYRET